MNFDFWSLASNCSNLPEILRKGVEDLRKQLENKEIPKYYPTFLINSLDNFILRNEFISNMGFTLISLDWIIPLSKWIGKRKCLEIMAGSGALSYALLKYGNIDIIPTDDYSWNNNNDSTVDAWWTNKKMWTHVENLDCIQAIEKYGKEIDIVIVSWPFMDDNAYKSLLKMREINPKAFMIYIGEGEGGCTANEDFFNTLEYVKDESFYNAVKDHKRWYGLHDRIHLVK
jgi:hypothetical protein